MLFTIIAVLVVIFAVGAYTQLDAKEKAVVTGRTLNALKYGSVHTIKATKSTLQATYQSGQLAGLELALNGQDQIDSMEKFNKEVSSKGGAVKIAHEDFEKFCKDLGLSNVNRDLRVTVATKQAELNTRRLARA